MNRFHLFESYTETVASAQTEKEAKKFFSALEPLMSNDITSDEAIKSLKDAMENLPDAQREMYKKTSAYSDYMNKLVDFFKISV